MKNRKKFGKLSTIALSAILCMSMLGQNLVMVYADGKSSTTEPLQSEDSNLDASQSVEQNKPKEAKDLDTTDKVDVNENDVDKEELDKADENNASVAKSVQDKVIKEVEPVKYPAWNQDYKLSDGTKIRVNVPEGALPEGTKLDVKPVKAVKVLDKIMKVAGHKLSAKNVTAYDFNFYNDNESNIEPKKDINIKFENLPLKELKDIKAYHVTDKMAQSVEAVNLSNQAGAVVLKAGEFSIYAITSDPKADSDGKVWIGDDTAKTYETINAAVDAASDGATIHISGNFGENGAPVASVTISKNITLDVAADTTMIGDSSKDGIILANGSHLKTSNGATLKMEGFNTGIMLNEGAEINDGKYNLSGGHGIVIKGIVKGSSGRDNLVLTSLDEKSDNFIQGGNHKFKNCTVKINSKSEEKIGSGWGGLFGAWVDGGHGLLDLDNVDMTVKGIGAGFYASLKLRDSTLTIDKYKKNIKTGMTLQAQPPFENTVDNSVININTGYQAGISIAAKTILKVNNSTINFNNEGTGGLNVNGGNVTFEDSILNQGNQSLSALYGSRNENGNLSSIEFLGSCVVNTDSPGGGRDGNSTYVVEGGSYSFDFTKIFTPDGSIKLSGSKTPQPTNSFGDNLSLFKLKKPNEVNSLKIKSVDGTKEYDYHVAKASKDGNKYIWVPAAKVTFNVNGNEDINATFSDGKSDDKFAYAIRGYKVELADKYNNVPNKLPENPIAVGYKFTGWYDGKDENAKKVDIENINVDKDMTLYAHWEKNPSSFGVIYHNNDSENDQKYIVEESIVDGKKEFAALSYNSIINKMSKFNIEDKEFTNWNTKPDGTGTSYEPGQKITADKDEIAINLFAQYKTRRNITVQFSANGGKFADDTIFVQNKKVFDLDEGHQVATVKEKAYKGETLEHLIKQLDNGFDISKLNLESTDGGFFSTPVPATKENWKLISYKESSNSFFGVSYTTYNYGWYPNKYAFENQVTVLDGKIKIQEPTTYYLGWKLPEKPAEGSGTSNDIVNKDVNVPVDLLINGNTTSEHPYYIKPGDKFSVSQDIDIASIKDDMSAIPSNFDDKSATIDLSDVNFKLSLKLTYPESLDIPDALSVDDVQLKGMSSDEFKVLNVINDSGKRTLTLDLALVLENENISYDQLIKKMESSNGNSKLMTLDIDGFSVKKDVALPAEDTTKVLSFDENVTGELMLSAKQGSSTKQFDFAITGMQAKAGADSVKNNTIGASLQLPNKVMAESNLTVYGDILVSNDTEHEKVYQVKENQKLTYTGRLYVEQVKSQIESVRNGYMDEAGGHPNTSDVKLYNAKSTFVTTLQMGEGLKVPQTINVKLDNYKSGSFEGNIYDLTEIALEYTDKDGNVVSTVLTNNGDGTYTIPNDKYSESMINPMIKAKMELNLEKVKKFIPEELKDKKIESDGIWFDALYNAVQALGGKDSTLNIHVGEIEVVAKSGQQKVLGTVTGDFNAVAKRISNTRGYDFVWNAVQQYNPEGKDFTLPENDTKTIQFTSEVIPAPTPTPSYKSLSVEKQWFDAEGKTMAAPTDKVKVVLTKADDKTFSKNLTLTKENKFNDKFTGLTGDITKYTVKERGEKDGIITIDSKKFKVAYSFDKAANKWTITNTLVKEDVQQPTPQNPQNPQTPQQPQNEVKPNKPQTGDTTDLLAFAMLGLASVALLGVAARRRSLKCNK